MPGVGHRDPVAADLTDADEHRGEVAVGQYVELGGAHGEHGGRGVPLAEVGPDGVAQGGHDGRRADAAPGDVADDEGEMLLVEGHDGVPVAADVHPACARDVAHRHLQPGDVGDGPGQKRLLQRGGDGALGPVQVIELFVQLGDRAGAALGLAPPGHQLLGDQRGGQGEQQAPDEEDEGQLRAERVAQGGPGRRHNGDGGVAEGHGDPDGVAPQGELGRRHIGGGQVGGPHRRTQVGGVVQVGEGGALLHRDPAVGRDGPLGVDGERRVGRVGHGVADVLRMPGRDAGDDEGGTVQGAGDEPLGRRRVGLEQGGRPDGGQRSWRPTARFPQ